MSYEQGELPFPVPIMDEADTPQRDGKKYSPVDQDTGSPGLRENTTHAPRSLYYQWIEPYLKGGKEYMRYCYQYAPDPGTPPHRGVKKLHIRGGSVGSPGLRENVRLIERAMKAGLSPKEVAHICHSFRDRRVKTHQSGSHQ